MAVPVAPFGTPSNVITPLGAGQLWVADYGLATEPTSATGALASGASGFYKVGYTNEGSTFTWSISSEPIEVAEEVEPVGYSTTQATGALAFVMAEATALNLQFALNGGLVHTAGAVVQPPAAGSEKRLLIVLDSQSGARWVFRKCLMGGDMESAFQKAPDKHSISTTFNLEKVDANSSFRVYPSATDLV